MHRTPFQGRTTFDRPPPGPRAETRPGRGPRRWRQRGRRGQVAPVATILGLLLVVTFIANYLSTTLPSQMSSNDLNHEIQVENQVGTLSALLQAVSQVGSAGMQILQPVSLGTLADPPFAAADSSVLSPGNLTGRFTVSYSITGPGPTTKTYSNVGALGGSLLVHLENAYTTPADVAYDQGAVIYAQPGGYPILIDPPPISYLNGALSLWIPSFQGNNHTEAGNGAAQVISRLVTYQALSYPVDGFSVSSGSSVTITVVTPYPSVWVSYLNSITPHSVTATCTGVRNVCTSAYQSSGPSATVSIVIPGVTTLSVDYASFAVTVA